MGSYLIRRILHAVIVLFAATCLVFVLVRLTGDPVRLMLPDEATEAQMEQTRDRLGLNRPIWQQYLDFMADAVRGDFGTSFRGGQPAMTLVLERMPATLKLAGMAILFAIAISLPTGIASARYKNSMIDVLGRFLALIGQAVPSFWLGTMLILLFSVRLQWFPAFGGGGIRSLVLPGFALGAYSAAIMSRLLRSSMLEVLSADYIRTARAKGLSEQGVLYRHALRNALRPYVTVLGLQVRVLLGGAVVIEAVFAYPGMGRLVLQSINYRDFPVVQAFIVLIVVIIVATNLIVDMLYLVIDPRVKIS